MGYFKNVIIAAAIAVGTSSAASAATYSIVGGFSGGELGDVAFDFTVTNDFSVDIADTASGLTLNSLTSTVEPSLVTTLSGGLGYSYVSASDLFEFGGLGFRIQGYGLGTNDFILSILNFNSNSPSVSRLFDVAATSTDISGAQVTSLDVSVVPLPAGLPLLLTGLAGFGVLRLRKKRAAQV